MLSGLHVPTPMTVDESAPAPLNASPMCTPMQGVSAPSMTFSAVVAGHDVNSLFDSGASHIFVSWELASKRRLRVSKKLPEGLRQARLPDGGELELLGQATVTVHFGGGLCVNVQCLVAHDL